MSKNDIDVGLILQKEELEELIAAISASCFISNMMVFPTNQRAELNEVMEKWEVEGMGKKLWAHLNVLQEVLDNETNKKCQREKDILWAQLNVLQEVLDNETN